MFHLFYQIKLNNTKVAILLVGVSLSESVQYKLHHASQSIMTFFDVLICSDPFASQCCINETQYWFGMHLKGE